MTLRTAALSAALLLASSLGAHAQLGVYGMVSTERLTGVNCLADATQALPTSCSSNDRIDRATGAGGGAYYDFFTLGPARLGVDVRGGIQKSNKSASTTLAGTNALRMDEALGGVRAAFSFRKNQLKPYAEAAVGWNGRREPASYASPNFLAYRLYAGLDIAILPVMDLRLPEVGIGQNIGFSGTSSNFVQSASVGIVLHLPRR